MTLTHKLDLENFQGDRTIEPSYKIDTRQRRFHLDVIVRTDARAHTHTHTHTHTTDRTSMP